MDETSESALQKSIYHAKKATAISAMINPYSNADALVAQHSALASAWADIHKSLLIQEEKQLSYRYEEVMKLV